MQGQIIKIISDLHIVSFNEKTYPCKCRGIFRKEHITPLVGDYVLFSPEKKLIEKILPRKNSKYSRITTNKSFDYLYLKRTWNKWKRNW